MYGVPYELFWHLNPTKMRPFQIAYERRLEAEDANAWLQGLYIKAAIDSAIMGKKNKYPEKPFSTKRDIVKANQTTAGIAAKKFDAWTKIFNERFQM